MQPLGGKKIMLPLGTKKITQPLGTKKIMQPLGTNKKSRNLSGQKNHATFWDKKSRNLSGQKKIMQPLREKNHATFQDKNKIPQPLSNFCQDVLSSSKFSLLKFYYIFLNKKTFLFSSYVVSALCWTRCTLRLMEVKQNVWFWAAAAGRCGERFADTQGPINDSNNQIRWGKYFPDEEIFGIFTESAPGLIQSESQYVCGYVCCIMSPSLTLDTCS